MYFHFNDYYNINHNTTPQQFDEMYENHTSDNYFPITYTSKNIGVNPLRHAVSTGNVNLINYIIKKITKEEVNALLFAYDLEYHPLIYYSIEMNTSDSHLNTYNNMRLSLNNTYNTIKKLIALGLPINVQEMDSLRLAACSVQPTDLEKGGVHTPAFKIVILLLKHGAKLIPNKDIVPENQKEISHVIELAQKEIEEERKVAIAKAVHLFSGLYDINSVLHELKFDVINVIAFKAFELWTGD